MSHSKVTSGIYVSLQELDKLKHRARGFSLLPRQPVRSLLAGRYGSKLRGRGLNFEEIRQYRAGDDIRNMDWKVTARTGKPHTRVYTEEKDRPVVCIVDQRISMFFGSRVNMKSVTAAQLASLAIWKGFHDGDRAGALIFNDRSFRYLKPHRSKKNISAILGSIVQYNNLLNLQHGTATNDDMLNTALEQLSALGSHDCIYLVISDFQGFDQNSARYIRHLSIKNDLLLCLIYDPLAMQLPESGLFIFTDGGVRVEIDAGYRRIQEKVPDVLKGRIKKLIEELSKFNVPTLPFNTENDVAEQLRKLLGRGQQYKS